MAKESISIDELGVFLTMSVPREVPRKIAKAGVRRCASQAKTVLVFGIAFLLAGFPIIFLVSPQKIISEIRLTIGATETTTGVFLRSEATNTSVNKQPIYRYFFRFKTPAGEDVSGTCYATGSAPSLREVLYLKANPKIARFVNTGLSEIGLWGLLLLIFPAIGAITVYLGLRSREKVLALLKNGVFTPGKITEVERMAIRVNNEYQHQVTVTFEVSGIETTSTYNAYGENAKLAQRKSANGETVGVLYDPQDPTRIIVADALMG